MEFTLPLCPSVNSYNHYKIMRRGKRLTIQSYPSLETERFYREAVPIIKEAMRRYGWKTILKGTFVEVYATFYMKKAGMDADNHFKCLNDAIQKAEVVENDSQIIPRCEDVFIDKDNPRIVVTIILSPKIGVFSSEVHKEDFLKKNCKQCSKNFLKCTCFKGFLENRVHDLDDEYTCKKIKFKRGEITVN